MHGFRSSTFHFGPSRTDIHWMSWTAPLRFARAPQLPPRARESSCQAVKSRIATAKLPPRARESSCQAVKSRMATAKLPPRARESSSQAVKSRIATAKLPPRARESSSQAVKSRTVKIGTTITAKNN